MCPVARYGSSVVRQPSVGTHHTHDLFDQFLFVFAVYPIQLCRRSTLKTFSRWAWTKWRWISLISAVVKNTADGHFKYKWPKVRASGASRALFGKEILLFSMSKSAQNLDRTSGTIKRRKFTSTTWDFTLTTWVFDTGIRTSIEKVPVWRFYPSMYVRFIALSVIVSPYCRE